MEFILGFLTGSITAGLYINWLIKSLKKKGYIKTEVTQKFKDEIEN